MCHSAASVQHVLLLVLVLLCSTDSPHSGPSIHQSVHRPFHYDCEPISERLDTVSDPPARYRSLDHFGNFRPGLSM
jgi:hypothetical protein